MSAALGHSRQYSDRLFQSIPQSGKRGRAPI
jgi:hypothetical protein